MHYYFFASPGPAGPTYDPHAQALFTRGGYTTSATYWSGTPYAITGQQLLDALHALATGLKGPAGLWDALDFIYPYAGDSLAGTLANLKSLDGSQDGSFHPGSQYVLAGNGLAQTAYGYLDANYNPAQRLSLDSNHLSVYTTTEGAGTQIDIGAGTGNGQSLFDVLANLNGIAYAENGTNGHLLYASVTNGLGLTVNTRTSGHDTALYRNAGLLVSSSTDLPNPAYPLEVAIGARGGSALFSQRAIAWASGGHGLTGSQVAALYALVQQYQTALHRQV